MSARERPSPKRFADHSTGLTGRKNARRQFCRTDHGQGFEQACGSIMFNVGSVIRPVLLRGAYDSEGGARMVICCILGKYRADEGLAFSKSAVYSCHV